MKIGIDARFWGLENGGLGRYTQELITGLEKVDNKNTYCIFLRRKYFNQLNFKKNFIKVKADYGHYGFSEQTLFLRQLISYRLDLMHFLNFNFPVLYNRKFIVTIHDLLMQKHRGASATTLPFYFYYPKQITAKIVFKKAITNACKVIVPSASVKREIEAIFGRQKNEIVVTHEGITNFPPLKTEKEEYLKTPYLLYVGNAYPHKNLEKAILAVKSFNLSSKLFFYIVSSRNIFVTKLENFIKKNNVEECVKILRFKKDSELFSIYKNSLGFIFPSLSEGFGLPGLEAMNSGTVCLASKIPVFKEIYKSVPIYFDPHEVKSIQKAIEQLVSLTVSQRESRVSAGHALVKNYSWDKMARQTVLAYEDSHSLRSG